MSDLVLLIIAHVCIATIAFIGLLFFNLHLRKDSPGYKHKSNDQILLELMQTVFPYYILAILAVSAVAFNTWIQPY